MSVVRLRSDILRADRASADRWYVTNGATAVGPVALELVERGVEAGKIPVESYIRHEMWKIWRPLSELCVVEGPRVSDAASTPIMAAAGVTAAMSSDAGGFDPRLTTMKPRMEAPVQVEMIELPPVSSEPMPGELPDLTASADATELAEEVDPEAGTVPRVRVPQAASSVEDITLPGRKPKTNEGVTADPLSEAAQLKDALLTLSSVILRDVGCEGVMVHRVDDEGAVAVVAHGPRMFDVLGLRTRLLDPAIVAAAAGILVVAEPTPGPAGQSVLLRLEKLGVIGAGGVMLPIRPKGRLFGTVEMGQGHAFDGAAIAKAEKLVRVLQAKIEAAGWKMD
ncbi:MAG: GAF domain-containing protein [Polyangiaceae bacterium]